MNLSLLRSFRIFRPGLVAILATLLACATGWAQEDKTLRQLLTVLSDAKMGDDYEAVKKLLPSLGALRPDAGEGNTEALVSTKAGKITLTGEFNFAQGRLVSHGLSTGQLTHKAAHEFLLRCLTILEERHGTSERRVDLPSDSDGPADSIVTSFSWRKNKTLFSVDFRFTPNFAVISWGAQAG